MSSENVRARAVDGRDGVVGTGVPGGGDMGTGGAPWGRGGGGAGRVDPVPVRPG